MALQAIANGGAMNGSFNLCGVLVGVAGEAEPDGRSGNQLDAGDVLVDANFVADIASQRNRRVDELPFGLALMAGGTLGWVSVLVKGNGVDIRKRWESREEQNQAREDGQLSGHTPHVTAPLEREMRHGDPLPLMQPTALIVRKVIDDPRACYPVDP